MLNELRSLLAEKKAQTGIEYLMILGGAILVVIVVGYVLKGTAQSAGQTATQQAQSTAIP